MAILNKNDLQQLSNSTYIDNTNGAIRPQDVRHFNDELIDSLVDETSYAVDSGSWNASLATIQNIVTNVLPNTGSYVTNSQTQSMSVSTASYVDLRGDGITVNYANGWIEITGSTDTGNSTVIVSDTPPDPLLYPSGTIWFNSINVSMYVNYWDGVSYNWIGVSASGPVVSASYSTTASYAQTSSYSSTSSYIDVTGSRIIANWNGSQLQLTGSADATVIISDTQPPPQSYVSGTLWFNSENTSMYISYDDGVNSLQWVGIAGAGPVDSSSYSVTSSHAITASWAQGGGNQTLQSVSTFGNSTSQSIDIRYRLTPNVTGSGTFTQGESVEARGDFSHASGYDTVANGDWSHAQGASTQADGNASHAEGVNSTANGYGSHAEGDGSISNGYGAHAEGYRGLAVGDSSHAEGKFTLAEGDFSHAQGISTWAQGEGSNAGGLGTVAQGIASDTRGRYTNAGNDYQSVVGQWNKPLTSTEAQGYFIIGDGSGLPGDPKQYHNLFVAGDGKVIISGTLDVRGTIVGISGSGSGPQIPYTAGPGIIINDYEISSLLRTVNGISPDLNGNVATTLTNVITGLSGSLIDSSSGDLTGSLTEGTVWVVSGMTGPDSGSNGLSYIWDGNNPGSWLRLSTLDIASADQRYVIQSPSTLFLGTASFYEEQDTLQTITTRGNITTQSIFINSSLANGRNMSVVPGAMAEHSHTEGDATYAGGIASHAEGHRTTVGENGIFAHAEGDRSVANGYGSHAEGDRSFANGSYSHAEGSTTSANGEYSHTEGGYNISNGNYSHAEGVFTTAGGEYSHAEGDFSIASGNGSHVEGVFNVSSGRYSHAEGDNTNANGYASHAEGERSFAGGYASHAEGYSTFAVGNYSHTEGDNTFANGYASHAEGERSFAGGYASHAEGYRTQTLGTGSHAEGNFTTSKGNYSHSEGSASLAVGRASHTEGFFTTALGIYSHAEGIGTVAIATGSHVSGKWNVPINEEGIVIIGDGIDNGIRKNVFTAGNSKVTVTGSLCILDVTPLNIQSATTSTPTNTTSPSKWIRVVLNGQQGFIPFYT